MRTLVKSGGWCGLSRSALFNFTTAPRPRSGFDGSSRKRCPQTRKPSLHHQLQRRIIGITKQEIKFWAKDKRLRRQVIVRLTPKEFLTAWIQHIPERYDHAVRSFGLFAPRATANNSAAVFVILGQSPKPRPRPVSWRSIKRDFGWDPLLDRQGNRMTWNRRIAPQSA